MKIGFFGNTNNYPLILARAMRDLGHDVVFVLASEVALDRPENRYADCQPPYEPWMHDFSPRWRTYFRTPWRRRAVNLLAACDFVVLNQYGPSLAHEIGRPSIALLTGSDLQYFANPATLDGILREKHREPAWIAVPLKMATFPKLIKRQREGIGNAKLVCHFSRGLVPEGDRLLDGLGVPDSRRTMLQMTDTRAIRYTPLPSNPVVRTFCATRLNWKRPIPPGFVELDYKGSDVMIRGLGEFVRGSGARLDIRLVRKGLHVPETMELIRAEGLEPFVTWLDEMSQQDVLREFEQADIIFEQFGQSVVGMAGFDGMAVGRPLIANGRPEELEAEVAAASPICQARTASEVAAQLGRLVFDRVERERVGLASRRFVERYFSAESGARRCVEWMKGATGARAADPD